MNRTCKISRLLIEKKKKNVVTTFATIFMQSIINGIENVQIHMKVIDTKNCGLRKSKNKNIIIWFNN